MAAVSPRRIAWIGFALFLATTPLFAKEKVVAYVPNWVDLKSFSETIDYAKLTHINIAFENPVDDTGTLSFHPRNDVLIAKAHDNHILVLVSIGGGSAADNKTLKARYFDLLSDAKRAGFVAKLASYVTEHGFDGLDVDIEGPSINQDYGAFVADLWGALKANGKLLTAALSQGYGGKNVPDSVFEHLDFVNVMAYDAKGSWNPNDPGQHSPLEFARQNVDYWLGRGLPASKTVLGVPFYGYGFGKAFRKGTYAYSEIVAAYPEAPRADQVGETIWYNGVATIEAKTAYALEHKLAGIMIWSLDNDVPGKNSLLAAIDRTYRSRGTEDPPAPQADRVGFPHDYAKSFEAIRTFERPEKERVITIFGNERAASVKRAGELPYPEGSVVVMETAAAVKDDGGGMRKGEVVGLHVMRKQQGFGAAYGPNRAGDWEYVEYRPDGTYITPPNKSFACAQCHVKAGVERDFVYRGRLPESLAK